MDDDISKKYSSMQKGGLALGKILNSLMDMSNVGVRLSDIEKEAVRQIDKFGGTPSFMSVEGYKWATCLCVNDQVVHGVPNQYILKEEDILTIDIGMLYQGYHTDTASTKYIHQNHTPISSSIDSFLKTGRKALHKAISSAKCGNHVGHISKSIEDTITASGYSIVKTLVGHGVGKNLHEQPQIPGFLKGNIEKTPVLKSGMTVAIEVIYAMGNGSVVYDNSDGWTIATSDGSLSAVFEHTVFIGSNETKVLTEADK